MRRHLLQSRAWAEYNKLEGHQVFWLEDDDYQCLAILHTTPIGNYLFCPYGPTLLSNNTNRSLGAALSALRTLAKEQRAFFVRIEPTASLTPMELKKFGLIKSHDQEPAHTWVLDLNIPEEELLDGIEKTKVRHFRNHEKKNITVRTTKNPDEIVILTKLLEDVGKRDKFNPQSEAHLRKQLEAGFATLYIAEYEGAPIAASLVYDHDGVRYYAHAGSDNNYRKLMGGTILLVQMILDAKNMGAETFDFWGITTSEDSKHPWYGFTQYKKSFGGRQVNYAGTWDLPINHAKYRFYQMIRQMNRMKNKLLR